MTYASLPPSPGHRLPEAECVSVAAQLVAALGHIHGLGAAHRDVKLENCLYRGSQVDSWRKTWINLPAEQGWVSKNIHQGPMPEGAFNQNQPLSPNIIKDKPTSSNSYQYPTTC